MTQWTSFRILLEFWALNPKMWINIVHHQAARTIARMDLHTITHIHYLKCLNTFSCFILMTQWIPKNGTDYTKWNLLHGHKYSTERRREQMVFFFNKKQHKSYTVCHSRTIYWSIIFFTIKSNHKSLSFIFVRIREKRECTESMHIRQFQCSPFSLSVGCW